MICKWMYEKNEESYLAVALTLMGIGALSVLLGSSRMLNIFFTKNNWLHFTKGLFCGFSVTLLITAIIISIKALNLIRKKQ